MSFFLEIYKASKNIFKDKRYLSSFVGLSLLLCTFMFLIPVYAIPGNTVKFQSVLYGYKDYLLLALLAMLSSLSIVTQVGSLFRGKNNGGTTILSGAGIFSGIVSSIFASATCGMCVAALFSFLGFGTILFLVESRWYIVVVAFGLLAASLYISSRKYNEGCEICIVK